MLVAVFFSPSICHGQGAEDVCNTRSTNTALLGLLKPATQQRLQQVHRSYNTTV
jgi:hypothetical protein